MRQLTSCIIDPPKVAEPENSSCGRDVELMTALSIRMSLIAPHRKSSSRPHHWRFYFSTHPPLPATSTRLSLQQSEFWLSRHRALSSMLDFVDDASTREKCMTSVTQLPAFIDPKQIPSKKPPFSAIVNHPFVHTVSISGNLEWELCDLMYVTDEHQ